VGREQHVPGGQVDIPADDRAVDRAGQDHGRDGDQQAEGQGQAKVGLQGRDRQQRAGVRRHEAVQHGETGEGRDADLEQGEPGAGGHQQDDGHEQDHADLEEQRDADQRRDPGEGPGQDTFGDPVHRRRDDPVGATGVGEQPADHRAQGDEEPHAADRRAHPCLEALDGLLRAHLGYQAEHCGAEDEREERMHLQDGDEHHHGADAEQCREDEDGVARRVCRGGSDHGAPPWATDDGTTICLYLLIPMFQSRSTESS
jgi:hypothetical protein